VDTVVRKEKEIKFGTADIDYHSPRGLAQPAQKNDIVTCPIKD
jgi:hypothetical protein